MKTKFMTEEQLQQKRIEELIWRKNREIIEVMKRIAPHELFGWKLKKESDAPSKPLFNEP